MKVIILVSIAIALAGVIILEFIKTFWDKSNKF